MDPVVLNFRETLQHRHLIGAFLDDFLRQDRICDVFTLLQDYLPAEELPDTLRLEFLASRPEIRYHDDTFQIDAGMAWAIGPTQLARALASIFYRMATSYELPSFTALQGPDLLMHTLRLVHHDAIPATIDRIDEKSFDVRHRGLAGWSVSEYALLSNAHHALKSLETSLPALLALEDPTAGDWSVFHRAFIRNNSTLAAGWFMARTIIDQLGWARLRAVGRSPADFFAAYLEAGALLPRHTDAPLHSEKWFLAHAPVPDEQTAAWIVAELRRRFG